MLCCITEKEVSLYKVELNINRLKAIRKKIIAKYGIKGTKVAMTEDDFQKLRYENYSEKFEFIIVNKKVKDNVVFFIDVSCPTLAVILDEIIKGHDESIQKLLLFQKYSDVIETRSCEKLHAYHEKYGYNLNMDGWIYIKQILENIKLTPVYKETYSDIFDLIDKLKQCGDRSIQDMASTIKEFLIPQELTPMDIGNQKKIGTV